MRADRSVGKVKGCKLNSIFAGVDLGDRESLATVLSPMGDVADRFTFPMNEEGYAYFAGRVPKDTRVAFESTIMAYPISRALRTRGYMDVTVAHPKTLAWIVRSKKKNDRVDSLKIAKLHMAGMLPESHLLDRDEQIVRDLLVQRTIEIIAGRPATVEIPAKIAEKVQDLAIARTPFSTGFRLHKQLRSLIQAQAL